MAQLEHLAVKLNGSKAFDHLIIITITITITITIVIIIISYI